VKSARTALKNDPQQAESALEYIDRLAEGGQAEMRALIFELRPDALLTDGLVAALERLGRLLQVRYQVNVDMRFVTSPIYLLR
jgi:signal transduction histidine kinase